MFKPVTLALVGVLVVSLAATGQPPKSDPLTPAEAVFLYAVAVKIADPPLDNQGLFSTAMKWASGSEKKQKIDEWKSSDDPLLKGLARLDTDAKLREQYRAGLKKRLGDDPEKNRAKLIADVSRDFSRERVAMYREELDTSKGKFLSPKGAPFPLCLVWPPCADN